MNNKNYELFGLMAIIFSGIIIKIFFQQNPTKNNIEGPANATIWGYSIILFSLFGILFISFALANKISMKDNTIQLIKNLFNTSLPILLLIAILSWILIINIKFKKIINSGLVASNYNQFSNISSFLIIIQILIVYKYLSYVVDKINNIITPNNKKEQNISQVIYISYILSLVNFIFAGLMNILLEYYSTDG